MAVVASGVFMATLDASIVNVSLPTLARDLEAPFASAQWITLAYLLVITGLLLPAGRLAQIIGTKRLFLIGLSIFTFGSLLAGLAPNIWSLVAFRVIQATGGAITQALGPGLVVGVFPPTERGKAVGLILTAVSAGLVTGPVLGGLILGSLGWPFLFLVNVPVGLIAITLGIRILPGSAERTGGAFDWIGSATLVAGLLSLLLGLNQIQRLGLISPVVIALVVLGLGLFLTFARRQSTTPEPTIDPALFQVPDFTTATLAGYLTFAGLATQILLLPFYLQDVLNLPIQQIGLLMVVVPALMGILGTPAGILADRTSERVVGSSGILISAIGLALLGTLSSDTPPLMIGLRLVVIGIGYALFNSGNSSTLMGAADISNRNQASAVLALARNLGQSTGQALWGTIWASIVILQFGQSNPDNTSGPEAVQAFRIVFGIGAIVVLVGALISIGSRSLKSHSEQVHQIDESKSTTCPEFPESTRSSSGSASGRNGSGDPSPATRRNC